MTPLVDFNFVSIKYSRTHGFILDLVNNFFAEMQKNGKKNAKTLKTTLIALGNLYTHNLEVE